MTASPLNIFCHRSPELTLPKRKLPIGKNYKKSWQSIKRNRAANHKKIMDPQSISYKTISTESVYIADLAISNVGQALIGKNADGTIFCWSLPEGKIEYTIPMDFPPRLPSDDSKGLEFIRKLRLDLSSSKPGAGLDELKQRFDESSDKLLLDMIKDPNVSQGIFVLDPKGQFMVTARGYIHNTTKEDKIQIWRLADGVNLKNIHTFDPVKQLFISPNGQLLASIYFSTLREPFARLWHLPSGTLASQIEMPRKFPDGFITRNSVRFSRNWKTMLLSIDYDDPVVDKVHSYVYQFSPNTSQIIKLQNLGRQSYFTSLRQQATSTDGSMLAIAYDSYDNRTNKNFPILLYGIVNSVFSSKFVRRGDLQGISSLPLLLYFTPDNQFLIGVGEDRLIRIWDVTSSKRHDPVRTLTGHQVEITCGLIHPKVQLLATGDSSGEIRIWRLDNGNSIKVLAEHTDRITCLATSPDGRFLVSSSKDKTIKLWEWEATPA